MTWPAFNQACTVTNRRGISLYLSLSAVLMVYQLSSIRERHLECLLRYYIIKSLHLPPPLQLSRLEVKLMVGRAVYCWCWTELFRGEWEIETLAWSLLTHIQHKHKNTFATFHQLGQLLYIYLLYPAISVWYLIFSVRPSPALASGGGATNASVRKVKLTRREIWN